MRFRTRSWSIARLALSVLVFFISIACSDGQDPKLKPTQELLFPLRGKPEGDGWKLLGSKAGNLVQYEESGMRIVLPLGKHYGSTGLSTGARVAGDFEITVSYDILREEPEPVDPAKTTATRIALLLALDRKVPNSAGLSRKITAGRGTQFNGWTTLWDEAAGKSPTKGKEYPAGEKKGRLRLARKGAQLSFYVAEGAHAPFELLKEVPFAEDDLKDVSVVANTAGTKSSIDVRISDLRIRMGTLIEAAPVALPNDGAAPANNLLLIAAILGASLALLIGVIAIVWLAWRRRAATVAMRAALDPLVVACLGCGRMLKVKPDHAGKKAKCAHCGTKVSIPAAGANVPIGS